MFIKHALLEGYLPFTHVGNKHVEFDVVEPVTAILGGNGSGKSSLLASISPFPASRPMYAKNGKIELTIEHKGHLYELGSHFENATSPCYFKKNGEELNPSGTGDVQKDLVEEHFGLKPYIWELVSGNMHVCSLAKAARKQLFSMFYPSDLSFVLDYYKQITSRIRTYNNQIKLQQQREGSLTAALINESERARLQQFRECALGIIDRIDKVNLLLENEIERLRQHPAMKKEYHPEELINISQRFEVLRKAYVYELLDHDAGKVYGEQVDYNGLTVTQMKLAAELEQFEKNKGFIQNNLEEIRDELNKFSNLKYSSVDDKKSAIVNEMSVIQTELRALDRDKSWQDTPIIPIEKLLDVIELETDIRDHVNQLRNYAGHLISQDTLDKMKGEIYLARNTMATLGREKADLDAQLQKANTRLEALTKNDYPQDCTRTCALRATVETAVRDVRLRIEDIKTRLADIAKHMNDSQQVISANEGKIQAISEALPTMRSLWTILTDNYLTEIALNGENYVDCLNMNCTEICNRVRRGVEASKKFHRYNNQKNRLDELSRTLAMMQSVETAQMSAEMIDSLIADRERKIEQGIKQLGDIEAHCHSLEKDLNRVSQMTMVVKSINKLITLAEDNMNIKIIRNRIEFDQTMIREHVAVKNELGTRLREIERTLDDQKRVYDVLNTEIRPTLEKLKVEKAKWEAVESGLNPTNGLPSVYLIRFINRLITRANKYIGEVWCYPMELQYLDEEEDLDFTIPVLLNKSTSIKDISEGSRGQQEMIDLAMMFALCAERGYFNEYAIKLDEIDSGMVETHRTALVAMLDRMVREGEVKQMFLVNHYAISTGMQSCQHLVLSTDGIVVPAVYNTTAKVY